MRLGARRWAASLGEVAAIDPRLISKVNHDRSVTEESPNSRLRRGIEIVIFRDEMFATIHIGDVAILAAQVADLTGCWIGSVTRRDLTTNERVKVGKSPGAVAISRNGLIMDVVYY